MAFEGSVFLLCFCNLEGRNIFFPVAVNNFFLSVEDDQRQTFNLLAINFSGADIGLSLVYFSQCIISLPMDFCFGIVT